MITSNEEALLHLQKWLQAKTKLAVFLQFSGTSLHSSLAARVDEIGSHVFLAHEAGRFNGFVSFELSKVVKWEYHEMDDLPELMLHVPETDLLTQRSILAAALLDGNVVVICDATPGVL